MSLRKLVSSGRDRQVHQLDLNGPAARQERAYPYALKPFDNAVDPIQRGIMVAQASWILTKWIGGRYSSSGRRDSRASSIVTKVPTPP